MTAIEGPPVGGADGRGPTAGDPAAARSLHHITVVTPEGVVLEFRAAGVASRMMAVALDLAIQYVLIIVMALVGAFLAAFSPTVALVFVVVGFFLVFWGYPAVLETFWGGRTVGKRVFGLRVLTIEGGPVGFRQAAIRALLSLVDFWLPAPGGVVALVAALTTKNSQRLGDLAAGTIVVRNVKDAAPTFFFNPVVGAEAYGLTLDASRLAPEHYALAREFLVRAPDLLPSSRAALGADLADRLVRASGTPRPEGMSPEAYLQSLLFAHQRRARASEAEPVGSIGYGPVGPPPGPSPTAGIGPPPAPSPTGLAGLPAPVGPPVTAPVTAPVASDLAGLPAPVGPPVAGAAPPDR
ncbi:MAG: RDD family protein [Actinomycetota bacterium]